MQPFLIHNHTEMSNFRLSDSTIKVEDLLDHSLELGLDGICITDHEALSAHIRAFRHIQNNPDKFKDFTMGYGNEIYLVDRNDVEYARENNTRTKYYHFVLLAKNENGYKGIRELSTAAWDNAFYHRGMQRVPLYYDQLESIMTKYKGDIIGSSACLGSYLSQSLLQSRGIKDDFREKDFTQEEIENARSGSNNFIRKMVNIFGDDFYIELQPAAREIQSQANELLYGIAKHYDIKPIITTDTHYLRKEDFYKHEIYLKAQEGNREVADFYKSTYLMNKDDLLEYFDKEILDELIENTQYIRSQIEPVKFGRSTQIPKAHIPEFTETNFFDGYRDKYEYIDKMLSSPEEVDRFYMYLLAEGFHNKNIEVTEERMDRINLELEQIWLLSEYFNQPMSGYFVFTKEIVDLMWEISIVAPGRGSAACYYTNYLLDIVQVDALKYDLPYWRFLHIARGEEMADIDLDSSTHKRDEVLDLVRRTYGHDSVLPMSTYTTEGSASAVQTACRGLNISTTEMMNISNSLTDDSLKDQYYGNPEKEIPINTRFKNMVDSHEGLFDLILSYDGLVKGRSQHASGVVVFNDGYVNEGNAMMKTTKGAEVTSYNADDTEFMGGLKIDLLSTDALTRIQTTMDLLLEDGIIEWQGSLRETYNKYLHPDVLDLSSEEMYDMLYRGEIISVFQFSTDVGSQAIRKVKARSFDDLAAANSLMRLSVKGAEQPIDKYTRFRDNINLWYEEMESSGLLPEEVAILEKHLKVRNGICDTQELLMLIIMDVAGYNLTEANKFRKLVAKANLKALEEEKETYIQRGRENGMRDIFLEYVWKYCFEHSFGYAFSLPHIVSYTLIAIQEMNLAHRYTPLYWQTACLVVDSGGNDSGGAKDYGKIARATNTLQGKVTSPHINKSGMTFTPVKDTNQIVFGLNPIKGLRKDTLDKLIENRPFNSFDDFYQRMVVTNEVSEKQTIILIKAGVFNQIENKTSWDIMVGFVNNIVKPKNLNMTRFPVVYEEGLLDQDRYKPQYDLYNLRQYIRKNKYIIKDRKIKEYIIDNFNFELDCDEDGNLIVLEKEFEKRYNEEVEPVKRILKNDNIINDYNRIEKREYWKDECLGTIESWEMETIGFYSDKHELDYLPLPNRQGFLDLKDGQQGVLAGVVIDKDKPKNIFYLSTQNGVATVKTYANIYNQYDEVIDNSKKGKDKVVYDSSWFDRGTKLLIEGKRDGNNMFTTRISRIYGQNERGIVTTTIKNRGE